MLVIFSLIDAMVTWKTNCYVRQHVIMQLLGLVCDVIILIFGNRVLRFVPLIADIIIVIVVCILLAHFYPERTKELCDKTLDKDTTLW